MLHHLQRARLVRIGQRLHEEAFEVFFQRQVDVGLDRVLPPLRGQFGDRAVRRHRAVENGEHPFVVRGARFGAHGLAGFRRRIVGGVDQLAAPLRGTQRRGLFGQRQRAQVAPDRQLVERRDRLERLQDADRPAVHLEEHASAGRGRLVGQREERPPVVRRFRRAEHAERHGDARIHGQRLEAVAILLDARRVEAGVFARDFEHAGVEFTQHADEAAHLVPVGQPAGDGLPVGRLVVARAGRGEPRGAGLDRAAYLALHGREIVGRRFVGERTLTHDVGTQRGMADVGRVVDALGEFVDRVQIFGIRRPTPRDAGVHGLGRDVLGAFQIAHDEQLVCFAARGEREAAVPHHYAGDPVPARAGAQRVPEHLGVHMRMAVDEAGRHDVPLGIDDLCGTVAQAADRRDFPLDDPDVGLKARQPGTVHHRPVFDEQVVLHGPSYRGCRPRRASLSAGGSRAV